MDGDIPDILDSLKFKKKYQALLMWTKPIRWALLKERDGGYRLLQYLGERNGYSLRIAQQIVWNLRRLRCWLKTFGGHAEVLRAGVLLYGASPTPANAAAALEALRVMVAEPERALRLFSEMRLLHRESQCRWFGYIQQS